MKQQTANHAHPIMIFYNIKQFLFLAIIPVLRGLLTTFAGNLSNWTNGLWIDLLFLFSILLFSILRWWRCCYWFDEKGITQQNGLFFQKETQLSWGHITVLKTAQPFYFRPIQACFLRADTLGGSYKKADIRLILPREHAANLSSFYTKMQNKQAADLVFAPPFSSVLAFALLSINSFTGAFYLAAFVSQTGKLLGREFSEMLAENMENFTKALSLQIPPAATAVAFGLLLVWFLGVLSTLLRYAHFFIVRKSNTLELYGGLFGWQQHSIHLKHIQYFSLQQNIVTYFLGATSLFLSAVGTGKERSDLTCLLPMLKKKGLSTSINRFFPELKPSELSLRPVPFGFVRFLSAPLFAVTIVCACWYALSAWQPKWADFIGFIATTFLIPVIVFFLLRIIEFRNSGIGYHNGYYTFCFSSGFTLFTQLIPKEKVVCILLRQGFWQKFSDKCDVLLYTQGESRKRHKCRNISKTRAMAFFQIENCAL